MTKEFKAHTPAPAKTAGRAPASPQAPSRRIAPAELEAAAKAKVTAKESPGKKPKEIGGPEGPEPTRYGDWERKGICVDF